MPKTSSTSFLDPELRCILSAYWCMRCSPKTCAFVDLAVMIYSYLALKPWHIKVGRSLLRRNTAGILQEAGGQV